MGPINCAPNPYMYQKAFIIEDCLCTLVKCDILSALFAKVNSLPKYLFTGIQNENGLSYDVASGSEITPCNKICKPLVVYRFTGNVMTSITT